MIKFQYDKPPGELESDLLRLAWLVSGNPAIWLLSPREQRYTIDIPRNNWFASLEDGVLRITYRYSTGEEDCPERCLGVLLDRNWSRA